MRTTILLRAVSPWIRKLASCLKISYRDKLGCDYLGRRIA